MTDALTSKMDERGRHIAQLEELVSQLEDVVGSQQTRIEQLQAKLVAQEASSNEVPEVTGAACRANDDELMELRAIVEAQEQALLDQKQIIAAQSSLIDELNTSLQEQIKLMSHERSRVSQSSLVESLVDSESLQSDVQVDFAANTIGTHCGSAVVGQSSGSVQNRSKSFCSSEDNAPASTGGHSAPHRSRRGPVGGCARVGGVPMTARSHRDILLEKQVRQNHHQSPRLDAQRPRPNSAYNRNAAKPAPRARSWNSPEQRSSNSSAHGSNSHCARTPHGSGHSGGVRTSSPPRILGRANGNSTGSQGANRKASGRIPPALPMLRQDA